MRKENVGRTKDISRSAINGYHRGRYGRNLLFTSDRTVELTADYKMPNGKPLTKCFGLEMETECNIRGLNGEQVATIYDRMLFADFPKDLWKKEDDASLGGVGSIGVECVTQVMTKEFIRNHYPEFKALYDHWMPLWNVSCVQSGNCGMHINISRSNFGTSAETQERAVKKLHYIVNKHYDFICGLVNRNRNRTGYCRQMAYNERENLNIERLSWDNNHGASINYAHWNEGDGRLELRVVGGQSNFSCFRNTMESVFWLVERVKTISWKECDDLVKVFSGCNKYVYSRLERCKNEGLLSVDAYERIRPTVEDVTYL